MYNICVQLKPTTIRSPTNHFLGGEERDQSNRLRLAYRFSASHSAGASVNKLRSAIATRPMSTTMTSTVMYGCATMDRSR